MRGKGQNGICVHAFFSLNKIIQYYNNKSQSANVSGPLEGRTKVKEDKI